NRRISVLRRNGSIEVIDLSGGGSPVTIREPDFKSQASAFSPDGEKIAVLFSSHYEKDKGWLSPEKGNLRIYSVVDGKELFSEKTPLLTGYRQALSWSSNLIAVAEAYQGDQRGVLL